MKKGTLIKYQNRHYLVNDGKARYGICIQLIVGGELTEFVEYIDKNTPFETVDYVKLQTTHSNIKYCKKRLFALRGRALYGNLVKTWEDVADKENCNVACLYNSRKREKVFISYEHVQKVVSAITKRTIRKSVKLTNIELL